MSYNREKPAKIYAPTKDIGEGEEMNVQEDLSSDQVKELYDYVNTTLGEKKMNIQEAIKSGKPFRRPLWRRYLKNDSPFHFLMGDDGAILHLTAQDILADDYELKEEMEDVHISIKPHRWWTEVIHPTGPKNVLCIPLNPGNLDEIKSLRDVQIHVVIDGKKPK